MIFGRSRAKHPEYELGDRRVEQETLRRWQNMAAQAFQNVTEFTHDKARAAWPSPAPKNEPEQRTIFLTDVASVEPPQAFQLDDDPEPEPEEQAPEQLAIPVPPCDLSLSLEEDLKRRFGSHIHSALGPGTVIEGTFRFDSPVCIDGTLIGEVHSTSVLIVGEQATVRAQIKVGSLVILGSVCGDVDAAELVEIRASGQLQGDIITKRLSLEEGGLFNGSCNMID